MNTQVQSHDDPHGMSGEQTETRTDSLQVKVHLPLTVITQPVPHAHRLCVCQNSGLDFWPDLCGLNIF